MKGVPQLDIFRKFASAKHGLVVDLFAGAGGASEGLEDALGRPVDIALNHDQVALAAHKLNHPYTVHLEADIWTVEPRKATGGRRVDVLWASPDCTHHSRARGGKPKSQGIRSLAWAVVRWAQAVKPRIIYLENVVEFQDWGPLHKACSAPDLCPEGDLEQVEHHDRCHFNKAIVERKGESFRKFVRALEARGYKVDWRKLDASHFGAPTKRVRLFLVARRDGKPVAWPTPTHGKGPGLKPLRTAAECIDWGIPCPSIFGRKKPLAEKTLWRIAQGIKRFVLDSPQPFVVSIDQRSTGDTSSSAGAPLSTITSKARHGLVAPVLAKVNHGGKRKREARSESPTEPLSTVTAERRGHMVVAPTLMQVGYGERKGQKARNLDLHAPLGTVVAQGAKHALVAAFLAKHFGGVVGTGMERPTSTITGRDHQSLVTGTLVKFNGECHGADLAAPVPTITAQGNHLYEVRAFLTAYYGDENGHDVGQPLTDPMRTIVGKDRFGLVTIQGAEYVITDIGMRMLEPHELLKAQFGDFAEDYDLSAATTKAKKVKLIGNSVCPHAAAALARANHRGETSQVAA